MKTIEKGWEGHFVCKDGTNVSHTIKEIRLDTEDKTIFDKKIEEGVFPFVVRMVTFILYLFNFKSFTILIRLASSKSESRTLGHLQLLLFREIRRKN